MELLAWAVVEAVLGIGMLLALGNSNPMTHESTLPSSSLPALANKEYVERGNVVNLGDLDVYVIGNGSRCIIWNYDIFGFDSGRSRQLCDIFADEGFTVIMPDYYRGTFQDPSKPGTSQFIKSQTNWSNLKKDWEEKIRPFAVESKHAETFGAIGTCWGSYMTVRLSAYPEVKAGVSMHPSHSPIMVRLGEDEEEIVKEIASPQLMMPSRTDSPNVKPDGLTEIILGEKLEIIEFPEMNHGWTTRGKLEDKKVDRDVKKAVNSAIQFFKMNL